MYTLEHCMEPVGVEMTNKATELHDEKQTLVNERELIF